MTENISDRLKKIRWNEGLSVSEFAKRIESTEERVVAWETGEIEPTPKERAAICLVFNCPEYWIVFGDAFRREGGNH